MKRSHSKGFTLLEMLIAVLVLSIALGGALEALSGFSATQAKLQERYCAHLVAWKDTIYSFLNQEFQPQSGLSQECGVDWAVNVDEVKIKSVIREKGNDDPEYIRTVYPITITTRKFDVSSPGDAEARRISGSLYTVKIQMR